MKNAGKRAQNTFKIHRNNEIITSALKGNFSAKAPFSRIY